MIILPLLCGPVSYGWYAYKAITYQQSPITVTDWSEVKKEVPWGSSEYERAYEETTDARIRSKYQHVLEEAGIRKDVYFWEEEDPSVHVACQGTNAFRKGGAVIFVAPNFRKVDEEAFCWVLRHEVAHIKFNDLFTMPLVASICSTVATIFAYLTQGVIASIVLSIVVGLIAHCVFSTYRESKADDYAIDRSTPDQLRGGRRYYKALQQFNVDKRTTLGNKILYSSEGTIRVDLYHPSLSSRIKKLENALESKKEPLEVPGDAKKMAALKEFFRQYEISVQSKEVGSADQAKQA